MPAVAGVKLLPVAITAPPAGKLYQFITKPAGAASTLMLVGDAPKQYLLPMGLVGAAIVGQLQLGAVITKAAVEQPSASVAVKLLFMLLVILLIMLLNISLLNKKILLRH